MQKRIVKDFTRSPVLEKIWSTATEYLAVLSNLSGPWRQSIRERSHLSKLTKEGLHCTRTLCSRYLAQCCTPQAYSAAASQISSRGRRGYRLLAPDRWGRERGPTAFRRNRLEQWRFRRPGGESVVTVCLGLGQGTTKGACIFSKTP